MKNPFEHLKRPVTVSPDQVLAALSQVLEPEVNRDIVSLGMVKNMEARDGRVRFTVQLREAGSPCRFYRQRARRAVLAIPAYATSISRLKPARALNCVRHPS
jgi:ATP-binding protein involved in chromosome partitioning